MKEFFVFLFSTIQFCMLFRFELIQFGLNFGEVPDRLTYRLTWKRLYSNSFNLDKYDFFDRPTDRILFALKNNLFVSNRLQVYQPASSYFLGQKIALKEKKLTYEEIRMSFLVELSDSAHQESGDSIFVSDNRHQFSAEHFLYFSDFLCLFSQTSAEFFLSARLIGQNPQLPRDIVFRVILQEKLFYCTGIY